MVDVVLHVVTVAMLALGVIPLGGLITYGGFKELREATATSEVAVALCMFAVGLFLIGIAIYSLAGGTIG